MVTGMTDTLNTFNNYFSNNYNGLVKYTIMIGQSVNLIEKRERWAKDILHDSYLKINNRLTMSGFTGNLTGYTMITINNALISHYNKVVKTIPIEINTDSIDNIEDILLAQEQEHKERVVYQNEIEIISRNIFRYLSTRYNDKQKYIFRTYFLNKKMTYKKVKKTTGYSLGFISETIKKIKQDLKYNFTHWMVANGVY